MCDLKKKGIQEDTQYDSPSCSTIKNRLLISSGEERALKMTPCHSGHPKHQPSMIKWRPFIAQSRMRDIYLFSK
jgi:hypothetical protein